MLGHSNLLRDVRDSGRYMSDDLPEAILKSLRQITRSIDLHSRELANLFGLTGPQLVCLRFVGKHGEVTPSRIAKEVSLSQATVTGIVDRLAARQLVTRERSTTDRRLVTVAITDAGRDLIDTAPYPLQESFLERLAQEPIEEQANIRNTLAKIVRMMDGEGIEAAPVLTTSPLIPESGTVGSETPAIAESLEPKP